MKKDRALFPLLSFLSGTGNWFTFIALIVHLQQTHGAAASTGLFLAQTVPALLVAGTLARRIPERSVKTFWIRIQLLVAAVTLIMSLFLESLPGLYLLAGVVMILRSVLNPLFMTMISRTVPQDSRPDTLRSVSAASALSLALAPAFGGALLPLTGPVALLLINASLTVCTALIMAFCTRISPADTSPRPSSLEAAASSRSGRLLSIPGVSALTRVEGTSIRVWKNASTRAWILLLLGGAALNASEAPLIFQVAHAGPEAFGTMVGAYGVGGMLVLIASMIGRTSIMRRVASVLTTRNATLALLGGFLLLALMPLLPLVGTLAAGTVGFFLLGMSISWLSGTIRSWLDSLHTGSGDSRTLSIWTWSSQVTLAVNLMVYAVFLGLYTAWEAGLWVLAPAALAYGALGSALLSRSAQDDDD